MKQSIKSEVSRIAQVLERINNLAESLPNDGPAPSYLSLFGDGEIQFHGGSRSNVVAVAKAFGDREWRRVPKGYSGATALDYVKVLACGVTIRIEGAQPIQTVESSEVSAEVFAQPETQGTLSPSLS